MSQVWFILMILDMGFSSNPFAILVIPFFINEEPKFISKPNRLSARRK